MTSAAVIRTFLGGPLRTATSVVGVLAVVAIVAAGWFGLSWYRVSHDESLAPRLTRNAVLSDAQHAVVNLNTVDSARVADALTLWEMSATGALLDQLRINRDSLSRTITDSKTATTARVIDAAVAALDERAGTAVVLVGVDITSRPERGEVACVSRRLQLDMRRGGDAWKVEKLTPVGNDNAAPGACPAPKPAPSK